MPARDSLIWNFKTLRGLHSNKTTWHQDRDGFLVYNNLENMPNFSRMRRGGAVSLSSSATWSHCVTTDGGIYRKEVPVVCADYSYVDTSDETLAANRRKLCMIGNACFYHYTAGDLSIVKEDIHKIVSYDSNTRDNARPTYVSFKNRFIFCTGTSVQSHAALVGSFSPGQSQIVIGGTPGLVPGDAVVIMGSSYPVTGAQIGGGNTTVTLGEALSGSFGGYVNGTDVVLNHNRKSNCFIYDPNDRRGPAINVPYTSVDIGNDLINYVAHGFENGNRVKYTKGTTAIGGLSDGTLYYIVDASANTFKLSATKGGSAINLTSQGTGTHTFSNYSTSSYPLSLLGAIAPSANLGYTIYRYWDNGDTDIRTEAWTYRGHPKSLASAGMSNDKTRLVLTSGSHLVEVQYDTGGITVLVPSIEVDTSMDKIVHVGHGLLTNQMVTYTAGDTGIGGLDNGARYWVYRLSANEFQLKKSKSGSVINFTSIGSGTHTFQRAWENLDLSGIGFGTGDYIYIDGEEYEIVNPPASDSPTLEDGCFYIAKHDSQGGPGVYDGISENIDSFPQDNTRWFIMYGELECNISYNYCYCYYNSVSGHISNPSPVTLLITPYRKFNVEFTSWDDLSDNTPNSGFHYDTIIIFRSRDGFVDMHEVLRFYSKRTYADATPIYDNIPDINLGMTAPLNLNAPPPNFMFIEEYQGRIWGASAFERSKLHFSCDEAQLASVNQYGSAFGRAEESFPGTNYIMVPADGGNITALKRAGMYLFVGTDTGLYIVTGSMALNYGLSKVYGGDGVYPQGIAEYTGMLAGNTPGAVFITKGGKCMLASSNGIQDIGNNVQDKLDLLMQMESVRIDKVASAYRAGAGITLEPGITYKSVKARNYIMISAYAKSGSSYTPAKCLVYDIDFNEWYYHEYYRTHSSPSLNPTSYRRTTDEWTCEMLGTTLIYGVPLIVGGHIYTDSTYASRYLDIDILYNDNSFTDLGYCDGAKYNMNTYKASLRTSFMDFDDRESLKSIVEMKAFANTADSGGISGYKAMVFFDENATHSIGPVNLYAESGPWQEANADGIAKEKIVHFKSGMGHLAGHNIAVELQWPDEQASEIVEFIQLRCQLKGKPE